MLYYLPLEYESKAILRVRNRTPYIAFPQPSTGRDPFVSTQLGLLRTRSILEPAVESLSAEFTSLPGGGDKTDWLKNSLDTKVRAELVYLSFTSEEAALSKTALDAILNSYLKYSQSFHSVTNDRVIELLVQERENRQAIVNSAKEKIRKEVEQSGSVFTDSQYSEAVTEGSFTAMERLLINTEVELEVLRARLMSEQERIESGEAEKATEQQLAEFVAASPEVSGLRQTIAVEAERLEGYMARLKDPESSPLVIKAKRRISNLQADLGKATLRLRADAERSFVAVSEAAITEQLDELENQVAAKTKIRDRLAERLQKQTSKLNNEVIDVEFARAELARQEDIYDKISARIVALQTERAAPDRVEVIDRPQLPVSPISRDWKKILVGILVGLFAPLVPCFLYERLAERVSNADSVTAGSGVDVLGETAKLPRFIEKSGVGAEGLRPFQDSVSCVASMLQLSNKIEGSTVVGVLSSISGEGKTSFSSQLGISLAQVTQAPVLLIEADFRAPDMRHLLNLDKVNGLTEILIGEKEVADVVQEDVAPGLACRLDVLTAGLQSDRSLPVDAKRFRELIDQLREHYEYIVIDTSPLLSTNESLSIATLTDVNLLCAMKGHSRMSQVRSSLARLARISVRPEGIVLNGVEHNSYYSRYGRYGTQVESV